MEKAARAMAITGKVKGAERALAMGRYRVPTCKERGLMVKVL
jgi:hypothetical protein